jgi:hypothetical protein
MIYSIHGGFSTAKLIPHRGVGYAMKSNISEREHTIHCLTIINSIRWLSNRGGESLAYDHNNFTSNYVTYVGENGGDMWFGEITEC